MTTTEQKIILCIDKSAKIKEITLKAKYPLTELYKKAGYKSSEEFIEIHKWDCSLDEVPYKISLYGKKEGVVGAQKAKKSINANKNAYEFPPPIETIYGNCLLVNNLGSLTEENWLQIIEQLFEKNGVENELYGIDVDDSDIDSVADDVVDDVCAVDTDNDTEVEVEDEEEEPIIEEPKLKKGKKRTKKNANKASELFFDILDEEYQEKYLYCTSELEPEPYI